MLSRKALMVLALLALLGAGLWAAVALSDVHTASACTTASATAPGVTVAGHSVGVDGTEVKSIPGVTTPGTSDVETVCVTATATATDQTVTTGGTTTAPTTAPTTTTTPPPACPQTAAHPYPCNSLWNTPIASSDPLNANSASIISYFLAHQANNPNAQNYYFGSAVATGHVATDCAYNATCTITCTSSSNCDVNSKGKVPIPTGTKPDISSDGHLAVFDPDRLLEFDFWVSKCPTNCGSTNNAGVYDAKLSGVGKTSPGNGVAANVPMLPGLLRPADISNGIADHALEGSVSGAAANYHVCPATAHDGSDANASAVAEGMLLQLDPTLNPTSYGLPAWQVAVFKTLQTYGLYVIDQGGTFTIKAQTFPGVSPSPWTAVGLNAGSDTNFASTFPWNKLRVVAPRTPWC